MTCDCGKGSYCKHDLFELEDEVERLRDENERLREFARRILRGGKPEAVKESGALYGISLDR